MDFLRQRDLFDAENFNRPIHVIGAGATGSYIALMAAKTTGSSQITVWDFDKVESHNLPNQLYGPSDVGKLKTEALEKIIFDLTGVKIQQAGKCDKNSSLEGIVFLAVDSMEARKEIFDGAIKYNVMIPLMVEMRLGIEVGVIYSVDPTNPLDIAKWGKEWYPDKEAVESPCTNRMISTTVTSVAGLCVHRMINWNKKRKIYPKMVIDLSSDGFYASQWDGVEEEEKEATSLVTADN